VFVQVAKLPEVAQKDAAPEKSLKQAQATPVPHSPLLVQDLAQVPLLSRTLSDGHGSAHVPLLRHKPLQH
jgi:hypothetical protein